jgi:hypothetical protein
MSGAAGAGAYCEGTGVRLIDCIALDPLFCAPAACEQAPDTYGD